MKLLVEEKHGLLEKCEKLETEVGKLKHSMEEMEVEKKNVEEKLQEEMMTMHEEVKNYYMHFKETIFLVMSYRFVSLSFWHVFYRCVKV